MHNRHEFLARDVIYTSRAYATMSVSVCLFICNVCALWSQGAMDPGYLCMLGRKAACMCVCVTTL